MEKWRNRLSVVMGFVALAFGVAGIFLPVLPTTPFLLLAAYLFARGSQRWYNWLIEHPMLGEYIRNYREDRSVPLRVKVYSITLLWGTMGLSIFVFVGDVLWLQVLLGVIGVGVTVHILSFKTRG